MTRIAQCHCGQVKLTCEGEPDPIIMCSCELCQRRTGAPFQVGAWFDRDKVKIEGETKAFSRDTGDMGMSLTFNFCPQCGTSIWWPGLTEGTFANRIGVAVGCFADRDFPPPTLVVYEKHRHPWVQLPDGAPAYEDFPRPED